MNGVPNQLRPVPCFGYRTKDAATTSASLGYRLAGMQVGTQLHNSNSHCVALLMVHSLGTTYIHTRVYERNVYGEEEEEGGEEGEWKVWWQGTVLDPRSNPSLSISIQLLNELDKGMWVRAFQLTCMQKEAFFQICAPPVTSC